MFFEAGGFGIFFIDYLLHHTAENSKQGIKMHFLNGFNGFFHSGEATTPSVMSNNPSKIVGKIEPNQTLATGYYSFTKPDDFEPYEQECYYNVAKMIEINDGEPVYGWVLWESSSMIEAEAHCLYRNVDGVVLDITPRVSGEDKILFVPDSRIKISLKHLSGTSFSMTQHTNPQLMISSNQFVPSRAVELEFDQSEIRVIKLSDYKNSFLFE
ncbi:hypothetical protein ACQUTF_08135 [Enterobacter cloacae]|uniref:hypothetical protein n=1 Tax=Enterobacter cloacae TaxID=550 RepID=UPI003D17B4A6